MMTLELLDQNKELICIMENDYMDLGYYGAKSGFIINCIDEDP